MNLNQLAAELAAFDPCDALNAMQVRFAHALAILQRVQAETREEDAKAVEAHKVPEDVLGTPLITFMLKPSIKACNEVLDLVAKSIRARKDRP